MSIFDELKTSLEEAVEIKQERKHRGSPDTKLRMLKQFVQALMYLKVNLLRPSVLVLIRLKAGKVSAETLPV
jgi:hypothetical protein